MLGDDVEVIKRGEFDPKEFGSLDQSEVYELAMRAGMEAQSLKSEVELLVVATREDAEQMDQLRTEIQTNIKKTEKIKQWFTEDAKRHVTKVNGFFAVISKPLKEAKDISGHKLVEYTKEQERKDREEAAQKAAAEAKAREDSVNKLKELANAAESKGDEFTAQVLTDRAVEAEAVGAAAMLPTATKPKKLGSTHFRTTWKAAITVGGEKDQLRWLERAINDWNGKEQDEVDKIGKAYEPRYIIPGTYWKINLEALNKLAQATSGTAYVPGVTFEEDKTPVTRGR